MVRLFICVKIPENVKKKLVVAQKDLKNDKINAKFVEEENLHLSLIFIGETKEEKINETKNYMTESAKKTKSFHVNLTGIKLFPSDYNIRVIGVKVLSENLNFVISEFNKDIKGLSHETNKITLCRLRKNLKKDSLKDFIEKYSLFNFGKI